MITIPPHINPKVDAYLAKPGKWQKELTALRGILLNSGLNEELKWSIPVYTYNKKNIAAIGGFKEYCALSFFKGALLGDDRAILSRVSEHTAFVRLIRFTDARDIVRLQSTIAAYIYEAIEIEKAGLSLDFEDRAPVSVPEELKAKLKKLPAVQKAFQALTPGRQRGYLMYFNDAKQSATRTARIEKCLPRILMGKGLND